MPPPTAIYIGRTGEARRNHHYQDIALNCKGYSDYAGATTARNPSYRDGSSLTDSSTSSRSKPISSPKQVYPFDKTHRRSITLFI
mmetsp:Transcript_13536/g.19974  ORF Transcript_13536/g.19974 Transcript_13536/m.19974 type:complete len:85 (-) Transcript_13536:220-474(-)